METAEQKPKPQTAVQERLVIAALLRDGGADQRAAVAERRLIRTVAEWEPGSGLDLLLRTEPRGGRVRVEFRPLGAVAPDWQKDVVRALGGIAALSRRRFGTPLATQPTRVAELVRDPARSRRASDDDIRPRDAASALGAPEVAWPLPSRGGDGILEALHATPGGFVRVLMAAPTDLERGMLHDELRTTWDRLAHPDLDAYLGSPVLMRSFVGLLGSAAGFAGLRATVRGWGSGLVLRDAGEIERIGFDALGADAVAGHVRPEGWALAGLRLPASGFRPATGMSSKSRPTEERPLERPAAPLVEPVVVGRARSATGRRVAAAIASADLCRHVFVEGKSGSGKTTFVTALIAELSRLGIGCTLLEHHGSGVDQALRALHPDAAARAIVVRHGDPRAPAAVNLFDERDPAVREQLVSEFVELVQAIFDPRGEGIVGPRWRRWFTLLCDAVVAGFGEEATLLHLLSVASDQERARRLVVRLAAVDRDLAARLHREVASLKGDEATNLPAWAISKFQPLVGQRAMREIIGRPRDAVDVTQAIDDGRTLLVDLGGTALGASGARMLGALWLLKHAVAMGRRRDRSRPHVVVVDEAQLMTFGALPALLAEARKFGIAVVVVTQSFEALSPALQTGVEGNVGTYLTFRLGLNTVGRASARLSGWPAEELVRLPDLRAAATFSRGATQTEPFLLTVERPPTDNPGAVAQAREVEERCAALWRSRAGGAVVTDADVDRILSAARLDSSGGPQQRGQSLVEEWRARRNADAQTSATTRVAGHAGS